jgi:sugar O-acyltransferase (sialic acid O-acetyltransferase NeuD family)
MSGRERDDTGFTRLIIFGAGGHGREVAWLAQERWRKRVSVVHVVDRPEFLRDPINGCPVRLLKDLELGPGDRYVAAVGDSQLRRRAVGCCEALGLGPATLIHPRAELSPSVSAAPGVIVWAGVVVTTNVTIGRHTHLNAGVTLNHDVHVGEFSTLSPGVHVAGYVRIGNDVLVGTGAAIINGRAGDPLVVGNGAVIAAGACVIKAVDAGTLVAGVPAVRKR